MLADLFDELETEARERARSLENLARLPHGFVERHYPLTRREQLELRRLKAAAAMARDVDTYVALAQGRAVDLDRLEPRFARNFRRRRELEAR